MNLKILLISWLPIIILTGLTNAKEKSDGKNDRLKGKAKSCVKMVYNAKNISGKVEKGDVAQNKIVLVFNDKGRITEQHNYNTDGSFSVKYLFKYNDKGNLIEINQYNADGGLVSKKVYDGKENLLDSKEYFSSDGNVTGRTTNRYDDKGRLIETEEYNVNGTFKYTYRYDDRGNLIEENHYNTNGNLDDKNTLTYRYNEKGNKIEETHYDGGSVSFYRYNNNGNLIEERYSPSFTARKACTYKKVMERCGHGGCGAESYCTYQYDGEGNKIKANCNGDQITYRYDSNGHEIEESCGSPSHKPWYQSIHQYDDKDNLIKEKRIENDIIGKDRNYQYTYDKQGNWIKKITFEKDVPQFIEQREITYYK